MNKNLSTSNIFQLNHTRASRESNSPYQQVTPPPSTSSTPLADKKASFFSIQSAVQSTTSLDATPLDQPQDKWTSWLPEVNVKVVSLCCLWYGVSIISNNTTKGILSQFAYPITLTQFQFIMNVFLCIGLFKVLTILPGWASTFPQASIPNVQSLNFSVWRFLKPDDLILSTTLPMGIFQFMGHITSHKATSVIPVSLVHTIKSLSPITTVLIYRLVFRTKFRKVTYLTLLPLIMGIMLTCYKPKHSNPHPSYVSGLCYASISMFIFVSQNIFAKKRLTVREEDKSSSLPSFKECDERKVDKLTILLFCSVIGFCFTMPIYAFSEFRNDVFSLSEVTPGLLFLVCVNGCSHFLQSLLAFQLLGTISPINYSIANIMKRIFVIVFAFVWEGSFSFTGSQSYGILLTVIGLYCYDKWGITKKYQ